MDRNTAIPLGIGAAIVLALVLTRKTGTKVPNGNGTQPTPDGTTTAPTPSDSEGTTYDPGAPRPGRPGRPSRPAPEGNGSAAPTRPGRPGGRPLPGMRFSASQAFDLWKNAGMTNPTPSFVNNAINQEIELGVRTPQNKNCERGGCPIYEKPLATPSGTANIARVEQARPVMVLFARNNVFAPNPLTGNPSNWAYIEYPAEGNKIARGWTQSSNLVGGFNPSDTTPPS